HVVFTEDGEPYESDRRQHRARRSQCKNWFNNDWLDRIIATLTFLSDEQQMLRVRVASAAEISISNELGTYESPISYVRTIADVPIPVTQDDYDVDDEEAEDGEEEVD